MTHSLIPRHVRLKGAPLQTTKLAPPALSGPVSGPETKGAPILTLPAQLFFGLTDSQLTETPLSGIGTYAASVLAYACMRFRATTFIEAPAWILDETDAGEEWLTGAHPLESLLEQPNPDFEAGEFWEMVSLYLDAPGGGAALLVKVRDRAGRVAALYPYSRPEFVVEPTEQRLFGRFRVQTLAGLQTYGPEDVIYLRETDPRNPLSVLSPGDAALRDLNLSEQQRRAIHAAFRNTVMPGSVTTVPDNLSDEQFARWQALMNARGGVDQAGRDLLIERGGSWTQVKASLKDLDLGPLSDRLESTICAAFGVNPLLLNLYAAKGQNSGLSDSLEPALRLYYALSQVPRWRRIASKLTAGLLREVEPTNLRRFIRFDTSGVEALQENIAEKVDTAAKATFWTTNEKRAYTGMAPTDDPADDDLQRAPAPNDEPDEDEPEEDEAAKRGAAPTESKAVSDRDIAWMLFDAIASAQEQSLLLTTRELLQADRDHIVGLVADHVTMVKGADGLPERKETARPLTPEELEAIEAAVSAYLAGEGAAAWRRKMQPALALVGRGAVERVAASVGVSFDVLQEGLLEYIDREAAWMITQVSDTTKDAVRRALRDGVAAGESIPDLAARIRDAAAFSEERATLIARTETVRATNGAQTEQMAAYAKRSGRTVTRTWLTARDDRVRDEHRALEGQVREIGKAFSNGEMFPSSPNCRCTTLIHVSDSEEAAT